MIKQLYLLSSFKTSGRFFQIFVAFSEKLGFNWSSYIHEPNFCFLALKYSIDILFENKNAAQEFIFLIMHGLANSQWKIILTYVLLLKVPWPFNILLTFLQTLNFWFSVLLHLFYKVCLILKIKYIPRWKKTHIHAVRKKSTHSGLW